MRDVKPLWKYSWPNGDQVYISEATGEVVQYTTTASRLGAYVGAIPHWLYFTPLRKNGPQWSRVVIWSSGIGTVAAILGIVIGIWMYSPRKRYRYQGAPTSIPYRGQKRWHTFRTISAWGGHVGVQRHAVHGSVSATDGRLLAVVRAARRRSRHSGSGRGGQVSRPAQVSNLAVRSWN